MSGHWTFLVVALKILIEIGRSLLTDWVFERTRLYPCIARFTFSEFIAIANKKGT